MQKIILACSLLFLQTARAQNDSNGLCLRIAAGYEWQALRWSIAGNLNGQNPNVYSELKWKHTGGAATEAWAVWLFGKKLAAFASYARVFISSGTVSDHDYNGDNRSNEIYGSHFAADRGRAGRWAAGLGYRLISKGRFRLTPFAGYGQTRQTLFLLDHKTNSGLNSTYKPVWKGWLARADASWKIAPAWTLGAGITYSQLRYAATADWNLIQTFEHPVSYRHEASGYSIESSACLLYRAGKHARLTLGGGHTILQTGTGTDELYLADGSRSRTQLNGVTARAFRVSAGLLLSY